jgi:sugar lactone lactonase YvrE
MSVERVVDSADRLGECPLWDERSHALWWVDILAPAIKRFDGKLEVFPLPEPVGSIAFRAKGGLLAAMQTGICLWDGGGLQLLACPDEHDKSHRFNDGRCDRAGRFWVGTMDDATHAPTGGLYRVSPDARCEPKRSRIAIPNSLCWSPDGRTMYFADSPRHKIWAYDYDADTGAMGNERLFAAPHPGFPDGSCVDADGCLWNAEYGGARVVRYTPAGKIDRVIEVPAQNPTCCCFGGAQLDTLYITTADARGVYATNLGLKGITEERFSG